MLTRREVGQRVRARRHALDLSQEALAALASVSRETIRRLEYGRLTPNLATFGKIADALQTTVSTLLAERFGDLADDLEIWIVVAREDRQQPIFRDAARAGDRVERHFFGHGEAPDVGLDELMEETAHARMVARSAGAAKWGLDWPSIPLWSCS